MVSMYLSMYSVPTENKTPKVESKPAQQNKSTPQKLYLRVPDMSGELFSKAKNMVDIFNEGTVKVIFYDNSTCKYSEYSERLNFSEYTISEFKKLLGEDNVVLK